MKHLKLFESFTGGGLSSTPPTWKVISHYEYLQELDKIDYIYDDSDINKVKSAIIKHKPDTEVKLTNNYIKVKIKYKYYITGEMKIYFLPDEWFVVSFMKDFKISKNYSYYKCDQIDGLIELINWI